MDGRYVAAVLNSGELPTVVVGEFGSTDLQAILQLEAIDDRIEWIQWANDDRLLVSASFSSYFAGERYRFNRLYAVDRDGKNLLPLINRTKRETGAFDWAVDTDRLLSILPDDREHILLQIYDRLDEGFAVFKVNIYDSKFDKQFINTYGVESWYADADGAVRLGIGYEEDVRHTWYFNVEAGNWEKLHSRKVFEGETFDAIAIDGDKAIVESDHELGRNARWQYDIRSGEFEKLLFAVDDYDIDGAIMSIDRTQVIGAAYSEHFEKRHYFDERDAQLDSIASSSFPGYQTFITSRSRDGKRLIVTAVRDDAPTRYFWLDLDSKRGGAWFSQYPYLKDIPLAKVTPFEFAARDGTQLSGYITLPATAGQAMQQDVYDAIDWARQHDQVDTDRACVVGLSYGGYVALTAAFQRSQQFRCIVSASGVSNLVDQVESFVNNETLRVVSRKSIGNSRDAVEKEMLIDNSPVTHIDKIASPVLLVHGDHDTQVRVKQSREFYGAARAAGVDIEYLEMDGGTHYFDENENRLALFQALDRFLKKHLLAP